MVPLVESQASFIVATESELNSIRGHKPLALDAASDSRDEKENDVAAQPISIPNEPPGEIKALIDTVLGSFNRKDSALYNGAFSEDAVVIDGIAPYRWTGPNAQARWFSDAEKWAHDFGVENETIVCDRIVHSTVVGTHAYVVLSATLFFILKAGQSGSKPGILTFTLAKQGNGWKVESQAWARLS